MTPVPLRKICEKLLGKLPEGSPLGAFLPVIDQAETEAALRGRAAVASTLVAGLELARGGTLGLDQDFSCAPITVYRRKADRSDQLAAE